MKKIVILFFLLLSVVGCKNQKELSPDEFQNKAEQKGGIGEPRQRVLPCF